MINFVIRLVFAITSFKHFSDSGCLRRWHAYGMYWNVLSATAHVYSSAGAENNNEWMKMMIIIICTCERLFHFKNGYSSARSHSISGFIYSWRRRVVVPIVYKCRVVYLLLLFVCCCSITASRAKLNSFKQSRYLYCLCSCAYCFDASRARVWEKEKNKYRTVNTRKA